MSDPKTNSVRLDGLHALKHALRFGAVITSAFTDDLDKVISTAKLIAQDQVPWLGENVEIITTSRLTSFTDSLHSTRIVAFANKPDFQDDLDQGLCRVVLEAPRHISNLGATIRVCAGAGVSALATTGTIDPWHPMAVRTSAGLHFAIGVKRYDNIALVCEELGGPKSGSPASGQVFGLDPDGLDIGDVEFGVSPILIFGTERAGLSPEAISQCTQLVRLPMRAGVSSLNLATSVAAATYHIALSSPRGVIS